MSNPTASRIAAAALAAAMAASTASADDRVLLRLTPEAYQSEDLRADLGAWGRTGLADLDRRLAELGAVGVKATLRFPPRRVGVSADRLRRWLTVEYAGDAKADDVAAALLAEAAVEAAGPDLPVHAAEVPDDPMFPDQWSHRNVGGVVAEDSTLVGAVDIDADTDLAWDVTHIANGIVIAVIDSGLDLDHPEFLRRIEPGYDFVEDDDVPQDENGHGTACAGIAAAAGDNGEGVAGVAWNARIMPMRVLDADGNGGVITLAEAITAAVDAGADLLSISIGIALPAYVVEDALAYAHDAGVPAFCAAGNEDLDSLTYPAAYTDLTIAVGALSPCGERKSPTSCDGETWWGSNHALDMVMAPGVRLPSTDILGEGGRDPGDYVPFFAGTSAATPFAAGVGALLLGLNPTLTPDQLEGRLKLSCQDMGDPGVDAETGWGRLNAHLAVLSAFTLPVYADAGYAGPETGSLHQPFDTLAEALAHAPASGTVVLFAGGYPQTLTLDAPLTLVAKDGIATIGQ